MLLALRYERIFEHLETVIMLGALTVALISYLVHELKLRAGQAWPIVNGTVESGLIVQNGHRHHIEIRYSYHVNGEYLSGLYIRPVFTNKKGEAIIDAVPRGTGVLVHYKPDAPDVSVLDRHEMQSRIDATPILTA